MVPIIIALAHFSKSLIPNPCHPPKSIVWKSEFKPLLHWDDASRTYLHHDDLFVHDTGVTVYQIVILSSLVYPANVTFDMIDSAGVS